MLDANDLKETLFCAGIEKHPSVCHKNKVRSSFYQSNDFSRYPNKGTIPLCKDCATMLIDPWDSKTFEWLLKEIDVPYLPWEWNAVLKKYGQDPRKTTGKSIFGRYLAKMRLKQYIDRRYSDSEWLCEMHYKDMREGLESAKLEESEIVQALATESKIISKPSVDWNPADVIINEGKTDNAVGVTSTTIATPAEIPVIPEVTAEDLGLTPEDMEYLTRKFGKGYTPEQLVHMELFCSDFMDSYDIQTAGHKDNLLKLAKVSLRLDELIEIGDTDGAQKMQQMYDRLMKTGNFTAQQNKEDLGDALDAVAKIVAICETDGYIEEYYIDQPNDKIDWIIKDNQSYVKNLIENETNLNELVADAVRMMAEDKENEARTDDADEGEDADIAQMFAADDAPNLVTVEDYEEFSNYEDELEEQDARVWDEV